MEVVMSKHINMQLLTASVIAFGMAVGALIAWPGKWDKAVALKICRDGTPILRLQDGSIWARRNGFTAYRVEDWQNIC
jgi:hypothetical protein